MKCVGGKIENSWTGKILWSELEFALLSGHDDKLCTQGQVTSLLCASVYLHCQL